MERLALDNIYILIRGLLDSLRELRNVYVTSLRSSMLTSMDNLQTFVVEQAATLTNLDGELFKGLSALRSM